MNHYLLDTNVLLDLFLNRAPWADDAEVIWEAHRHFQLRASVAAFAIPTIYYIVEKQEGFAVARTAVGACLTTLDIVSTDRSTLVAAQAFTGIDFEDDLQIATGVQNAVDAIVTRNPKDFAGSPIPVLTPADVVTLLRTPQKP